MRLRVNSADAPELCSEWELHYSASEKGTRLIQNEARVVVMADVALASFIGGFFFIYKYMSSFGRLTAMKSAHVLMAAEESSEAIMRASPESAGAFMAAVAPKSSLWLFAGLLLVVMAGIIIYALFRKQNKNP
ncbi:MAG: hypothetical protein KJ955_08275 [Nanoarchaeota archaeon]|nr:hypothetical protein [Nanoarchaeota archaeon]